MNIPFSIVLHLPILLLHTMKDNLYAYQNTMDVCLEY